MSIELLRPRKGIAIAAGVLPSPCGVSRGLRIRHAHLLTEAQALLDAGRKEEAMASATGALAAFRQAQDPEGEAEALLCLSHVELRLFGRFMPALEHAQAAVLGFERSGAVSGECRALAALANAGARLGHFEAAMETALLAARLAHWQGLAWEQLIAYRAVGFVAFHGRNLEEARNAYEQAILLTERCAPPVNPFELHLGLAAIETAHYATERCLMGPSSLATIVEALERRVDQCVRWMDMPGRRPSLTPGSHPTNMMMLSMAKAQLGVWRNQLPEAQAAFADMKQRITQPWQMTLLHWMEAELALAVGRLSDAVGAASRMVEVAQTQQHASLTSVGLKVLSHLHHVRGDDFAALQALHRLVRYEHATRAQSLKARLDVVDLKLEQRLEKMRLQQAATDFRLFEKLAMEDPLTGLANRRHFEGALAAHLAAGTSPLCAALIDVDRFKRVNDTYSHQAGDAVLKAIAVVLRGALRAEDLVARLGGDEFVVLLPNAAIAAASQVAEQIDQAVRRHPWRDIAPGLQVSISVGVAESEPGDTMAQLLQRCDQRMYAVKRKRRRTR